MQYNLLEASANQIALRPLRPRQEQAIAAIRQAIRDGHKRIVVQAPTGFGKTLTAAHIIAGAIGKGKRPVFICPAINLVNQTLRSFEAEGIRDIGVIQAQHERTDWQAQTQIASVQTLIRRQLPEAHLVLIDEVHQTFDKLNEILDGDAWKDKVVIGLSATPWTRGMGLRWTKLIIAATTKELIEEGFLTPFRIFAPERDIDLSGVKVTKGEYEDAGLSKVMSDKVIVGDAVKEWLEKAQGLPTFMFCVDRAHAKSMRDEFAEAGVPCGYIDGNSSDEERLETFTRYRRGDDLVIASVGCLIVGIDEDVRCILDCAPTKSESRHVQKIGRGLRTAPGKTELLILDPAGNTLRLGMVTDIHHEKLDTRKKGDKSDAYEDEKPAPKPSKCKKCFAVIPSGSKKCPTCGAERTRESQVEIRDGELVEFGFGKPKTPKKAPRDQKQIDYSSFLYIAEERGYKKGWAANQYRAMHGVWPRGLMEVPIRPSIAVRRFEQQRRREFLAAKNFTPHAERAA